MFSLLRTACLAGLVSVGLVAAAQAKSGITASYEETVAYLDRNLRPAEILGNGIEVSFEATGDCVFRVQFEDAFGSSISSSFGASQIEAQPQAVGSMLRFAGSGILPVLNVQMLNLSSPEGQGMRLGPHADAHCTDESCFSVWPSDDLNLLISTNQPDPTQSRVARAMVHLLTLCGAYVDPFAEQEN